MITGQIIQTSIDELKAITKVDLGVYDLNGSEVASTMEKDDITTDLITGFAASPADSQVIGVHHLLKIRDEGDLLYVLVARGMTDDVYMVGKIAVSQIQNLVIAYKERFDRNNFFQNLYEKPCNLFVAGFMGSPQMNFLDATVKVEGDIANLVIAGHSIPLPPAKSKKLIDGGYDGKVVTFGIRPEDVYDSEMYIETSPQSVFTSTIKVYELLGAEVYLYFDLDEFPMTARVDSRTTARPGDTVKFALDVEKIHVFDKETEQVITN